MRIIFLNAYHLGLREVLERFVSDEAARTDIFCFQEASEGAHIAGETLGDAFQLLTAEESVAGARPYSLATYVRRSIQVVGHRPVSHADAATGLGLLVQLIVGGRTVSILNTHGNPHVIEPQDTKSDSVERLRQSDDFLQAVASAEPDIIGGDFNLLPDTESLELFRRAGYRDLIREYAIPTTRNHLAWDRFPDGPKYLFSDYVFVSPEIQVKSFTLPEVEVSDHLPLVVDIEIP